MAQNQTWPVHERIRAANGDGLSEREATKQGSELFSGKLTLPA
ncbi:hypothetical protein VCR14J2_410280 [Vibrio coralliirubri]|nr:hypothetical protein VCR14J2_410280 [Vibrio coralliirubri]